MTNVVQMANVIDLDPVMAGRYHCCDVCGYVWRDRPFPGRCAQCKTSALYIATFTTRAAAELHVPLFPELAAGPPR